MPSPKSVKDTEPQDVAVPAADGPATAPVETPEPSGAYEYVYFADSVYPHVPLTARAATTDTAATVFVWPFGPPDDGRWAPTTKSPNQAADNAGPLIIEE
jgi:hypothetical protein